MLIILFLGSHFNFLFVLRGGLSWLPIRLLLHVKYTLSYSGADLGFQNGGGHRSSAEGASMEAPQAPREWGLGRGYPPPQWGRGLCEASLWEGSLWRGGYAPSPENFLIFRPGMLHFEANFRQLTRPVAIILKPAKSCDIVESTHTKSK